MFIYNVTVNVEQEVADEWLHWMKTVHIPAMMAAGTCFHQHKILKILSEEENNSGVTYAIQYEFNDLDGFNLFITGAAPQLQRIHFDRYKDLHVAFSTLLQVV
jgi:hypothetical protein